MYCSLMISVEAREYDSSGFANLDEAVALAKEQGIANARGAINEDVLWDLHSFGCMIGMGLVAEVPGIDEHGTRYNGVSVHLVNTNRTIPRLADLLENVEGRVITAAGSSLPGWQPTKSPTGVRMVAMSREAKFGEHTDDYEGLVASAQIAISGNKIMHALVDHEWEDAHIQTGDITLFAGDTFSEKSRILHGFNFMGSFAVAFTLGQDPMYTISGNLPLLDANPHYLADIFRTRYRAQTDF